jgi:hypothetical protein
VPRAFTFFGALTFRELRELRLAVARAPRLPPALLRFDDVARELELRNPELPRRAVLPREVREPVSPARPREREPTFFAREPLVLPVDEERVERALPREELREVVDFVEARPSLRLRLRERVAPPDMDLLDDFERDRLLEPLPARALVERPPPRELPRCVRDSAACAVSRLTILLKLLRCPLAVLS